MAPGGDKGRGRGGVAGVNRILVDGEVGQGGKMIQA